MSVMDTAGVFDGRPALAGLRRASIPRLCASDWAATEAKIGLREIARLRGELAAAQAVLTVVMAQETGRDTTAALSRHTGMSDREAREATKVAEVVAKLAGAEAALASGAVTGAHLAALAPVVGTEDAAGLLELAAGQSPEEFVKTVQRVRIEREGPTLAAKQQAARSLKFFNDEYGCIGLRGVLPPLAGTALKTRLEQIADDAWRAAHPERASVLGGHDDEPYERRLADALVSLVCGPDNPYSGGTSTANSTGNSTGTGTVNWTENGDDGPDSSVVTTGTEPATAARTRSGTATRTAADTDPRRTSSTGRPTVVVTINAETLQTQIVGHGPITFTEAADLAAHADLYAAIQSTTGAILKFGRNRRLASPLQRLALIVRDGGCVWHGCTTDHTRCDADHDPPWDEGGLTNIDDLRLCCRPKHHPHRHETSQNIAQCPECGNSVIVDANSQPVDAPPRHRPDEAVAQRKAEAQREAKTQRAFRQAHGPEESGEPLSMTGFRILPNTDPADAHETGFLWSTDSPPWTEDELDAEFALLLASETSGVPNG